MEQKLLKSTILLVAASALGLGSSARADDTVASPPATPMASAGLLGYTYAGLSYSYVHLDNSPVRADRYSFEYSAPIKAGFDMVYNYDRTQNELFAGDRAYGQSADAVVRAFATKYSWGKPYLEGGVGYEWTKIAGINQSSFAWVAGTGIEFQATKALTITPVIRYVQTNGLPDHHTVDYGVKANYWLTKQLALTAGITRNDSEDMSYKFGFNMRF